MRSDARFQRRRGHLTPRGGYDDGLLVVDPNADFVTHDTPLSTVFVDGSDSPRERQPKRVDETSRNSLSPFAHVVDAVKPWPAVPMTRPRSQRMRLVQRRRIPGMTANDTPRIICSVPHSPKPSFLNLFKRGSRVSLSMVY